MYKLKKIIPPKYLITIITILALINSCTVQYSLNGASIHPDAKTVNVLYFENRAPLINPELSQLVTEGLKDRFLSQTSLRISNNDDADLIFEGTITGYEIRPVSIQSNDQAAENQLTITMVVKFTNALEEKWNYEASFSRFAKFDSNQEFSSVENDLVEDILEELIEDIFNKAVANW